MKQNNYNNYNRVSNFAIHLALIIGMIFMTIFIIASTSQNAHGQTTSQSKSTHCAGIKANGQPCRSTVKAPKTHCRWHDPKSTKCNYVKKDGTKCKMIVNKGESSCRYHNKSQPFSFNF